MIDDEAFFQPVLAHAVMEELGATTGRRNAFAAAFNDAAEMIAQRRFAKRVPAMPTQRPAQLYGS